MGINKIQVESKCAYHLRLFMVLAKLNIVHSVFDRRNFVWDDYG